MSQLSDSRRLSLEQLRRTCDESSFDFDSTQGVPPLEDIIGQDRAIDSLEFGLKIDSPGYNIYVSGLSGVGRQTLIKTHLENLVRYAPTPEDLCLVHNFAHPDAPRVIVLPPGKGCEFRRDMEQLVASIRDEVGRSFESKEYESEVQEIGQASQATSRQPPRSWCFSMTNSPFGSGGQVDGSAASQL